MNRFRKWASLATFALAAALVWRCGVTVDETEYVLITQFGRIVAVYGDDGDETGLHVKWPWQSTLVVDRRFHLLDPPARETITADKHNLEVASYVVWFVRDPERFVRGSANKEDAEARLSERVAAALSNTIGRRELAALASTDDAAWALDALTEEVRADVARRASDELGITVVDVRLRRFTPPVEVRPAIFELIRSERKQVAATLRAEGEAQYQTIVSQADRQRDAILAQADAEAERIRGQADAEATRLSNDAHGRDPKFYEFVRTLDAYRALIDDKSTVVLSSSSPLLKLLNQGPAAELLTPPPGRAEHAP